MFNWVPNFNPTDSACAGFGRKDGRRIRINQAIKLLVVDTERASTPLEICATRWPRLVNQYRHPGTWLRSLEKRERRIIDALTNGSLPRRLMLHAQRGVCQSQLKSAPVQNHFSCRRPDDGHPRLQSLKIMDSWLYNRSSLLLFSMGQRVSNISDDAS